MNELAARLLDGCSSLRGTSFSLHVVYDRIDDSPEEGFLVAFDPHVGLAVLLLHEHGCLSEAWETACVRCGEIRERIPTPSFPLRPVVVSSVVGAASRCADFIPNDHFVGSDDVLSERRLRRALAAIEVTPFPSLLRYLRSLYVRVEPTDPYGWQHEDREARVKINSV